MERNDKLVMNKIDGEVKRFELLEKTFSKITEAEKTLKEKRMAAFEGIVKIEDENGYLNEIYSNFKQSMIDLENSRTKKIDKLDKTILPAVRYYPTKVKEFKKPLNKIKDLSKSVENHESNIEKARKKSDMDSAKKFEEEKLKASQTRVMEGKNFEKDIVEFEAQRVDDNKAVLLQFIHMELAYHANALQAMSKLYSEINVMDPKEKLRDFINKYNLNSMRDFNLEDKYKFKEGETEKRKDELKNHKASGSTVVEEKKGPKPIVDASKRNVTDDKKVSVREKILEDKIEDLD